MTWYDQDGISLQTVVCLSTCIPWSIFLDHKGWIVLKALEKSKNMIPTVLPAWSTQERVCWSREIMASLSQTTACLECLYKSIQVLFVRCEGKWSSWGQMELFWHQKKEGTFSWLKVVPQSPKTTAWTDQKIILNLYKISIGLHCKNILCLPGSVAHPFHPSTLSSQSMSFSDQ